METQAQNQHQYDPLVFDQPDMQRAASCILHHHSEDTEQRWRRETPHTMSVLDTYVQWSRDSVAVDFGCGIGRLAKELIARYDCTVIGIDLSLSMLKYAIEYVASPKFIPVPLPSWDKIGVRADLVVAAWVLQHCPFIDDEISKIHSLLKPDGRLYCLNTNGRFIPGRGYWMDDSVNIREKLQSQFSTIIVDKLPLSVTSQEIHDISWWGVFQKS
jgi:cyclopropane fatty-acyl-phospholipid synthase-like methyltransferase